MAINSYPDNSGGEVNFPDQLIDPVSKFRVSNPENLIDTDFEYGLQPTKWETVELINNTPSFFSKSGDTTIDGISSIITNAGTREIIVKTELDHGLAVGIPINVTGTKSITADGAYIINSIPDTKTFTYLCKNNQPDTNSILDLYSSIITGEFFQGSQLRISDSDGIVTDAEGTSILTVTTNTTHGFGEGTPFYFLNLNSTVAQEFQAANTAARSFDASNSATAQTFDGSNSLSSVNIDWSNSATFGGTPSTVSATSVANDTITVTHQPGENFSGRPLGTPLYYSVSSTGGYFNTNPRGVVFLKTIDQLGTTTSTFQVSLVPDGDPINLTENLSGTFQIANQARTFAGNNINPLTQTVINAEVGNTFNFDGANNGYVDSGLGGTPPNNTLTVISYTGTTINAGGASAVDAYVGAMVLYSSTGTAATGLTTNTTYFIRSFTNNTGGNYDFSVSALPGGTAISVSGGTGTQTFSRIGISLDKDIVHIPNSNFAKDDMLEYTFPVDGRFGVVEPEQAKRFYFVDTVYDSHNYKLSETLSFKPVIATGGNFTTEVYENGRVYRVHTFTSTGTSNFVVSDEGADGQVEYLVVGGGGSGGTRHGGGGGAGGFVQGTATVTAQTYSVVVGAGGLGQVHSNGGLPGGNSSALGIVALGGGAGQGFPAAQPNGGSGGGSPDGFVTFGTATQPGSASGGFGNRGGSGTSNPWYGGGGGGAGGVGENVVANVRAGNGGPGRSSSINGTLTFYAGGGGGASWQGNPSNISGIGGIGGGGNGSINNATPAPAQANRGGGGGAHGGESTGFGGNGGSGIVILRYPTSPEPSGEFIIATGGQISVVNEGGIKYAVHSFTDTGTTNFIVSSISSNPSNNQAQYLIIGGGGAGAQRHSGGGGAGGYRTGSIAITAAQTYPVVVGAGAPGVAQSVLPTVNFPVQGGNSSALGIVAQGGGAGGSGTGGSGGGANTGAGVGLGTAGQGNNGGQGNPGPFAAQSSYTGGGGGGAGTTGFNATVATPSTGGNGGNGLSSSITGTPVTRAGGGGGGAAADGVRGGFGGTGGGGAGGSTGAGVSGLPNTGGGGGGGGFDQATNFATGGGGSGIVIIRYPIGLA